MAAELEGVPTLEYQQFWFRANFPGIEMYVTADCGLLRTALNRKVLHSTVVLRFLFLSICILEYGSYKGANATSLPVHSSVGKSFSSIHIFMCIDRPSWDSWQTLQINRNWIVIENTNHLRWSSIAIDSLSWPSWRSA